MTPLAEKIERRLEELKKSARAASLEAGLGPDGIRNILRGRSISPRVETLQKIADALQVDIAWLSGQRNPPSMPPVTSHDMVRMKGLRQEARPAPLATPGGRDLPVLGAARGGEQGYFLSNGELFEMTERPASLVGIAEAYAVYMVGESMEPRYHNGETLFVHPFRPPERGKYVVVQLHGESEHASDLEMEYLVKQYLGKTSKEIILFQFNPQKELRFPLRRVRAVHRVVGTKDD